MKPLVNAHRHEPQHVDTIDLETLPTGHVSRLKLGLVHDGLGNTIDVPVLVMRGERPGPVFGLTAAVHGNEVNGIPVIHRLFEKLEARKLKGTVVAIPAVNVPGIHNHTRVFNDGVDLNKIFPGKEDGNTSQVYVHRLCETYIKHLDYLVDLHTASAGRVNSLYVRADMKTRTTARMAYLQRPQIILHNEPSDGTLRDYAMEQNVPAITVEIGDPSSYNPEYIKLALAGVRAVMAEIGMIPKRKRLMTHQPVLCESSYWLYTHHGGLLEVFPNVTDHIEQGQHIARLTDIYGELIEDYHAPEAGVVIGKSENPVGQSGSRIVHLGIPTKDPEAYLRFEP
jgi:predicted deacylase